MRPVRDVDQLISTSDVARILELTPDGVRYLERRGKLPAAQYLPSGQRLFRLKDVEELARVRAGAVIVGEQQPPAA
jgi:DNA-binding transcriptional MerR regulator